MLAAEFGVTQTHGFFIIMGGFHYFSDTGENYPLTWQDVGSLLKANTITLPTEEEILDKSKSDSLAKIIVIIQTLWFATQCIARRLEYLATTELEIVTLAYAAISLGLFIAWWDKPVNVKCPIRVSHRYTEKDHADAVNWWEALLSVIIGWQDYLTDLHLEQNVPMFYSGKPEQREIYIADTITLAAGVIFGAIHCVAWSFHFPSYIQSLLWRVSSAAITIVPVLVFVTFLTGFLKEALESAPVTALFALSGLMYVAARCITVVLAFLDLASLSASALQAVHWTTLIPHV